MKVSRDDLRAVTEGRTYGPFTLTDYAEVTPEEFHEIATAEGYVKLDVDVDQVRAAATEKGWNDGLRAAVLVPFARQVLAALDGETT